VAQHAHEELPFDTFDPVRYQPDAPWAGLASPCGQVLALYFGGGEPHYRSYVSAWAGAPYNAFVSQLVARYASPAEASTKFTQLVKDIPTCADALRRDPTATLALTVGDITSESAHFEQRQAGANAGLPDRHTVAVEYQLLGDSIVGVASSQSAAVVSALTRELGGRVYG
ncbi:hypothetical protein, partial [Mycolicibacter minnesotensis]